MKKNILFVNGHLNVGGIEKSLIDILRNIDYDRFQVDLLLLEEVGDYKAEIPDEVNVIFRGLKNTYGPLIQCLMRCIKQRDWFSLRMRLIFLLMKYFGQSKIKLARKLLTGNKHYDCAVGYRSGICTQIAAFAVDADNRITWWHHGDFNVDEKSYSEMVASCNTVVSVSQSCADMLKEKIPGIAEKLIVIPNMIDTDLLRKKAGAVSPYDNSETVNIVTVCRISPEKHVENIIYASRELKRKGYNFCWHIVGDGFLKEEMEKLSLENSLSDCVVFEGSKVNPYPYMKYAYLYVHPSYIESQGITILEAMALGVPCVVTKSRGPCEFIKDGENGLLVDPSPEALTQGVKNILDDAGLYSYIKQNTSCPDAYASKRVMQQVEKLIYNKLNPDDN